jgi:hypothetical protein
LWRLRSSDQIDVVIHLLLCFLQRFRLVAFHPIEVFTKMSETRQTKKPWNCKAFQKTYIYTIQVGVKEWPVLMVSLLPTDSDLINLRNCLEYILSKIPVVSLRPVSLSLKLKGWILKQDIIIAQKFVQTKTIKLNRYVTSNIRIITCVISFPCTRLYALVHFTFRGFLFILKFLWHFDLQNRKICT